jgi:hypothetical protein
MADAEGLHVSKTDRVRAIWSTDVHLGLTGVPFSTSRRR